MSSLTAQEYLFSVSAGHLFFQNLSFFVFDAYGSSAIKVTGELPAQRKKNPQVSNATVATFRVVLNLNLVLTKYYLASFHPTLQSNYDEDSIIAIQSEIRNG